MNFENRKKNLIDAHVNTVVKVNIQISLLLRNQMFLEYIAVFLGNLAKIVGWALVDQRAGAQGEFCAFSWLTVRLDSTWGRRPIWEILEPALLASPPRGFAENGESVHEGCFRNNCLCTLKEHQTILTFFKSIKRFWLGFTSWSMRKYILKHK